ncbi:MAG: hypothetical protein LBU27_05715 [Candidatus Peribacteria bacterium]|jgi:hypothetical protein|nr:hypothetical protein [Candidatus Peribacteria bacterium]
MKKVFVLGMIISLCVSCTVKTRDIRDEKSFSDEAGNRYAVNAEYYGKASIEHFGENVYRFTVSQMDYEKALATFLKNHPDLEVSTALPQGGGKFYHIKWYSITFRKKSE